MNTQPSAQPSIHALQSLANHIRRYQADMAARALADQRIKAAFGEQAEAKPEDAKIIAIPAIAEAEN